MSDAEIARQFIVDVFGTTQFYFGGTDVLGALTKLVAATREQGRMDALYPQSALELSDDRAIEMTDFITAMRGSSNA